MMKYLDPGDVARFTKRFDDLLNTKDPEAKRVIDGRKTWEMATFYHNPVVASVALLTKMQSDVKNAEADAVELHVYGGYLMDQFQSELWNNRTD